MSFITCIRYGCERMIHWLQWKSLYLERWRGEVKSPQRDQSICNLQSNISFDYNFPFNVSNCAVQHWSTSAAVQKTYDSLLKHKEPEEALMEGTDPEEGLEKEWPIRGGRQRGEGARGKEEDEHSTSLPLTSKPQPLTLRSVKYEQVHAM